MALSARNSERVPVRRGVILPMVAIILPVLVLFLGFAVDIAYMQNTRLELRAATDAAARAAATTLSTTDNETTARNRAIEIAAANQVAGRPLQISDSDIEFGRSNQNDSGRWVFDAASRPANSVRIDTGDRVSVPLFFGKLINTPVFQPTTSTVAAFVNVDICLVLDRSTSMKVSVDSTEKGLYTTDPRFCSMPTSDSRWMALDAAVKVFTDTLRQGNAIEQVAVATYSSVLDPDSYCGGSDDPSSLDLALTKDLSRVDSRIDDLSADVWNGNTNIEAGMRTGIDALVNATNARAQADRYLIVMTDGNQNVGNAEDAAELADANDIRVHTVTFSVDANQTLMKSVASRARGRHIHANTPEELRDAFRELAAIAAQLTD